MLRDGYCHHEDKQMSRSDIGKHKTIVAIFPTGRKTVTYHNTDVVTVEADGTVTLNNGGWKSNTTKLRMNQASRQFGLGFGVYQRDFEWFVSFKNPAYTAEGNEPYLLDSAHDLPFDSRTISFKR
jgi:hypothetical protein